MAYYPANHVWPPAANAMAYRPVPYASPYPAQAYVVPQGAVQNPAAPFADVWREIGRLRTLLDEEIQARNRQQYEYEKRVAELERDLVELRAVVTKQLTTPSTDDIPDPASFSAPISTPDTTSAVLPALLAELLDGPKPHIDCSSPVEDQPQSACLGEMGQKELYLFGGMSRNCKGHDSVEKFDVLNGLWDDVDTLPGDLNRAHLSAVGMSESQVLLFSAFPSEGTSNTVYRYNTSPGTHLSLVQDSETCRYLGAHCRLGDLVCVAGGYVCKPPYVAPFPSPLENAIWHRCSVLWSRSMFPFPPSLSRMDALSTVETFNPEHQTWNYLPSLPDPMIKNTIVAESPNVVYSVGGMMFGQREFLQPTGAVYRFDLRHGRWMTLASMSYCRAFFDTVLLRDHSLVALGGICASINASPRLQTAATHTMEQYDARNNSWSPLPSMRSSRCLLSAHVMDNSQIYVIGGVPSLSRNQDSVHPYGMDIYAFEEEKWIEVGMLAGTSDQRFAHASCVI